MGGQEFFSSPQSLLQNDTLWWRLYYKEQEIKVQIFQQFISLMP